MRREISTQFSSLSFNKADTKRLLYYHEKSVYLLYKAFEFCFHSAFCLEQLAGHKSLH